jgi:L-threonylcarbamoyladenylate synthase
LGLPGSIHQTDKFDQTPLPGLHCDVITQVLDDIQEAADLLRRGGLVAFPTETVFGLGVDATNSVALARLFEAKGRPTDNPLIVHLADVEQWQLVASDMPDIAQRLLAEFSPGPLTVVLPKHRTIAPAVTAGLNTVGLRIPAHPLAKELIAASGLPIAAPSANRSGRPSGTSWQTVLEDLDGRIHAVLRGSTSEIGLESTVVDCVSEPPRLLRPGAISLQQLQFIAPEIVALDPDSVDASTNSPGLRHRHYQPLATVNLIRTARDLDAIWPESFRQTNLYEPTLASCAYCGLEETDLRNDLGACRIFDSTQDYARDLYEFLRTVDRLGLRQVYCQTVDENGIGAALNDRLSRAAH